MDITTFLQDGSVQLGKRKNNPLVVPPVTSSKPPAKKRKKKDPKAPKRPLSAYVYFYKDRHASIRAEFPDLRPPDVTRKLGHEWSTMDDQSKSKFYALQTEGREKYKVEKEAYDRTQKLAKTVRVRPSFTVVTWDSDSDSDSDTGFDFGADSDSDSDSDSDEDGSIEKDCSSKSKTTPAKNLTIEQMEGEAFINAMCSAAISYESRKKYENSYEQAIDEGVKAEYEAEVQKTRDKMLQQERWKEDEARERERKTASSFLKESQREDSVLRENLEGLGVKELQQELQFRGLASTGVKTVLIQRLKRYFKEIGCVEDAEEGYYEMCGERNIRNVAKEFPQLLSPTCKWDKIVDILHDNTLVQKSTLRENRFYIWKILKELGGTPHPVRKRSC
jgi:hypothetical protein